MTIILMIDSFVADIAEKIQSRLFRMMNFCLLLALLRNPATSSGTTRMGLNRGVPVEGRSLSLIFLEDFFSWENHSCNTCS